MSLRVILLLAAVCATFSLSAAPETFLRNADGAVEIDSLRFFLRHSDANWKTVEQSPSSLIFPAEAGVQRGGAISRQGIFKVSGGEFELTETVDMSRKGVAVLDFTVTSPSGITSKNLSLVVRLPLKRFAKLPILFNDRDVNFYEGGKFQETLNSAGEARIVIPLRNGRLLISGNFTATLQDNRRYGSELLDLRMNFTRPSGLIRDSRFRCTLQWLPDESEQIDLAPAANMGFRDEKAADGTGGWTDQGSDNDLRTLPAGVLEADGIRFRIIDPAANRGKSCIMLRGAERPGFPEAATVAIPDSGKTYRYFYLLHAIAWPAPTGTQIGELEFRYADGRIVKSPVRSGVDVGNFWSPGALKNGAVAWRAENNSANIGLYASAFPVDGQLTAVVFRSSGRSVWGIVAAGLGDAALSPAETSVVIRESAEWRPIRNRRDIVPGSILDFSDLTDAPAGKYGRVVAVGGQFGFASRPGRSVRFWGTNLALDAPFLERKDADRLAAELAAGGNNLVRLHGFDRILHGGSTGRTSLADAGKLDRLDYLFAALKARGIYVTLDLFAMRYPLKGEIADWPDRALHFHEYKALAFINENVMRNFEEFSRNLLDHVNPYTGMAWKEDPALIGISLINEGTLSHVAGRNDFVRKEFEKSFQRWSAGRKVVPEERDGLYYRFLQETYRRGFERMRDFLRKLGYDGMLTDQNYRGDVSTTLMRNSYDYVDLHFYWAHPQFMGRNWKPPVTVDAASSIGISGARGLSYMFAPRIFGKPFMITEWDYVNPNPYNVEGAFLTGAYAALQGYAGLCNYEYSGSARRLGEEESALELFDHANDPLRLLALRAGSLFFLRGDVQTSPVVFPVVLTRDPLRNTVFFPAALDVLGTIAGVGTVFGTESLPKGTRGLLRFKWSGPQKEEKIPVVAIDSVHDTLRSLQREKLLPDGCYDPGEMRFSSVTGELELNGLRKSFRAATPNSEGFVAPAGIPLAGKEFSVLNRDTFSAVLAASRDGLPLRESRRILILHLTDTKNTGMKFADGAMSVLEEWGTLPLLMRYGRADISWTARDGQKLYACDLDGSRLFEVPLRKENGRNSFIAENVSGRNVVCVYELVTGI